MTETTAELTGRALDAEVAERVFNHEVIYPYRDSHLHQRNSAWRNYPWRKNAQAFGGTSEVPRYSSDIAAAWQVVERMRERGWLIHIHTLMDGYLVIALETQPSERATQLWCRNLPQGLCRAALAALAAEPETR
jgi:hypothetical protein